MAKRKARSPFDVSISAEQRKDLGLWLCQEIENGLDARGTSEQDVDYCHRLYEQARTRSVKNQPWPNAADLTSYLGTQNVDSLQARLMKTVWVEPLCTVEGWGPSAKNAPFVEEFHQWQAEESRLQSTLDKLSLLCLIEPRGLLECYEGTEMRRVRKEGWFEVELMPQIDPLTGEPTGVSLPVFEADGNPKLKVQDGKFVEAQDEATPSAKAIVDSWEPIRTGPQERVIPYRDSLILPGHARDKSEIWGYGKRFWRRLPEIQASADRGLYDADSVKQLTDTTEREPDAALQRTGQTVASSQDPSTAEKELWEFTFLKDLDGKGERWYIATVNLNAQVLLRLQYDDVDRARYVPFILFPRPDRATEGYSFIGHKLLTTIEEHTAWRNMNADRSALVVNAPIKKLQGALWDEFEQPFGPHQVITVRDMREIEPMQIPDVPASSIQREQSMERTAERLAGVNDIAAGQVVGQGDKTLGEVQMATEQSFVRMDLIIRRFQESLEDLMQIRHAIWKRTLAEQPDGLEAPQSIQIGLEARNAPLPSGRFTAHLLEGSFKFKPRGSVETADPRALRADFNMMLQALPALIQAWPMLQIILSSPEAARAMLEQFVRVYRIPNRQAFLSVATMLQQPMPMMGGMPPGMPGQAMLPPGPPAQPPMAPGPAMVQ